MFTETTTKQYKVYQIVLTKEEVDKVNAEGHGSVPKHSARTDMHFTDNPETIAYDAMSKGFYTHVANVTASNLENVFEIGNSDFEDNYFDRIKLKKLKPMHSVSIGDVIENPEGVQYVVAEIGFKKLGE